MISAENNQGLRDFVEDSSAKLSKDNLVQYNWIDFVSNVVLDPLIIKICVDLEEVNLTPDMIINPINEIPLTNLLELPNSFYFVWENNSPETCCFHGFTSK